MAKEALSLEELFNKIWQEARKLNMFECTFKSFSELIDNPKAYIEKRIIKSKELIEIRKEKRMLVSLYKQPECIELISLITRLKTQREWFDKLQTIDIERQGSRVLVLKFY